MNKQSTTVDIKLSLEGYSVAFYGEVSEITNDWNALAGSNLFMHSSFLGALEATPPSGTSFRYALVKRKSEIVGCVYFQVKVIDLYESLRLDLKSPSGFWSNISHQIKCFCAKRLKAHILVCGNMTLTGENGFVFDSSISKGQYQELLDATIDEMVCHLKRERIKARVVLVKDFFRSFDSGHSEWKYTEFQVQPNMILKVRSEWENFEDYLGAMKSKYRVRVKRARKKATALSKRKLSLEEIHAYGDQINALYGNVVAQAGFNLFYLPKGYFYSLQKNLKDKMSIIAYFEEGKMVGFYTAINSHGELDAHFLGYEPNCNKTCQLYLNMLYDLANDAIDIKASALIMSRTAMEIKSSVGAEGHEMYLYMKATNGIFNRIVASALNYFKPNTSWEPRSPFK